MSLHREKPSLEELINLAYSRLAAIQAAANSEIDDDIFTAEQVLGSINDLAREAKELLEPIRHAPPDVANWTPKKGDAT